ncbi:MAG TPA: hypothetical protein VKS21_01625, partial [Spirochaetota bacterium]|nr:hypothetical protein [Spirochaetota bacterium]
MTIGSAFNFGPCDINKRPGIKFLYLAVIFIIGISALNAAFDQRPGVFLSGGALSTAGDLSMQSAVGGWGSAAVQHNAELTNSDGQPLLYLANHYLRDQVVRYIRLSFRSSGPSAAPVRIHAELLGRRTNLVYRNISNNFLTLTASGSGKAWTGGTFSGTLAGTNPAAYQYQPPDAAEDDFYVTSDSQELNVQIGAQLKNIFNEDANTVYYYGDDTLDFIQFPRVTARDPFFLTNNFTSTNTPDLVWSNATAAWEKTLLSFSNIEPENIFNVNWTNGFPDDITLPAANSNYTLYVWVLDTDGASNYNEVAFTCPVNFDTLPPDNTNIPAVHPYDFGQLTTVYGVVPSDHGGIGVNRWVLSNSDGTLVTNQLNQLSNTVTGLSNNTLYDTAIRFIDAF